MNYIKSDSGLLDTELLPTPDVLANDLKEIVHKLDEWESLPLLALRLLPSVRFSGAKNQSASSNGVIPMRIGDAISGLADTQKQEALWALFDWDKPTSGVGVRQVEASNALDMKHETFRKEAETRLLITLAAEIFRGELAWATHQFEPSPNNLGDWSVNSWHDLLEFERSIVIDGRDPRKQTWTTRMRMRCVKHDLPLLVTSQRWSGGGEDDSSREPGEITVPSNNQTRSGSTPSSKVSLLDCRKYSDDEFGFYLYLWSLGKIRPVGEEFEHSWQQVLIDKAGGFKPYIGFGTGSFPTIRKVCLRLKLPAGAHVNVEGRHLKRRGEPVSSAYTGPTLVMAEPAIPIAKGADGYFTYDPPQVIYPDAYELWWGKS
jgi:hypothetical protein